MEVRSVCTKNQPWKPGKGKAIHPEAILVADDYDSTGCHDDFSRYRCPHCGLEFTVTIPN